MDGQGGGESSLPVNQPGNTCTVRKKEGDPFAYAKRGVDCSPDGLLMAR